MSQKKAAPPAHVRDASAADFEAQVVARSCEVPVIVDFWAAWCGPCRALGPVLEAVVGERAGEVELVKVDTDANQELATRYQVRGIPAVKAFVDGRVVDEFVGAQDRRFVSEFVDRLVPPAQERTLAQARELIDAGRAADAEPLLAPLIEGSAYHDQAQLLQARARAQLGDSAGARASLAAIDSGSAFANDATALAARLELEAASLALDTDLDGDLERGLDAALARLQRTPDDHALRFAVAGRLFVEARLADALEQLLELVQRSRAYGEDVGRRAMLAIFDAEGPHSELAREFRRRLQIYL